MALVLPRRTFLAGMATVFAAPAIVRSESIMRVKAIDDVATTVSRYSFKAMFNINGVLFQKDITPLVTVEAGEGGDVVRFVVKEDAPLLGVQMFYTTEDSGPIGLPSMMTTYIPGGAISPARSGLVMVPRGRG